MAINLANFVRTSLRAPIGPTDTVLQLSLGTGGFFNFPAGDYCYITLEDRLNHEIVRFTATGTIVGDNISVQRAQDGTLARAFPAGTCVKVAWNEQQVKDLITEMFNALVTNDCPPANTVTVDAVPVGAPPSCVYYAINRAATPWKVYFWDGAAWHLLGDGDTIYTGEDPIKVDASTKKISLTLGPGLQTVGGKLTLKLDTQSGLVLDSAGILTIDCAKLGTHCPK